METTIKLNELELIRAAFNYWTTLQQFDDTTKDYFEFDSSDYLKPFKRADYFVKISLDHDEEICTINFWDEDGEFEDDNAFKIIEKW